ncbi:unnamed protein product [Rotaria sp. Silwood2]|nr:unnamed protein product [Rotaria sp. Silwood2]
MDPDPGGISFLDPDPDPGLIYSGSDPVSVSPISSTLCIYEQGSNLETVPNSGSSSNSLSQGVWRSGIVGRRRRR